MKITDPLACGDHHNAELAAFLHNPQKRRIAADSVRFGQNDRKAEAVRLTPQKHVFIDLAQAKAPAAICSCSSGCLCRSITNPCSLAARRSILPATAFSLKS